MKHATYTCDAFVDVRPTRCKNEAVTRVSIHALISVQRMFVGDVEPSPAAIIGLDACAEHAANVVIEDGRLFFRYSEPVK